MMGEKFLLDGREGYTIQIDEETSSLIVDTAISKSRIVIDLLLGKISIESPGDIQIHAGGKLVLRGDAGVDIESGGNVGMIAAEETIVRGKMVRIN